MRVGIFDSGVGGLSSLAYFRKLAPEVDAVFFASRRMRVDSTTGKAAPVGADGGERVIRTNGSPACIAKNRYALPTEIPLSWTAFMECLKV